MKQKQIRNIAFIDGQNLNRGTKLRHWKIDLFKLRDYLHGVWRCDVAYYFMGAKLGSQDVLYRDIRRAGFVLIFREHMSGALSGKKGNVDADIVFMVMQKIADGEDFGLVVLASGDGDYFRMIKYLIVKKRLVCLLIPSNKTASSLYRKINSKYIFCLSDKDIKVRIELK